MGWRWVPAVLLRTVVVNGYTVPSGSRVMAAMTQSGPVFRWHGSAIPVEVSGLRSVKVEVQAIESKPTARDEEYNEVK